MHDVYVWHNDIILSTSQFNACESQSEENANPRSLLQTHSSALHLLLRIHRRVRRFRKVMSSLFGGSHGYIPSLAGFTDGSSLVRGPHESGQKVREKERERAWKPRGWPSLADRWKIHKLFQEKRRKSISNYSFLWRVAAGHARQGVRLMATRAHRSTSSASSSSSSASSTPLSTSSSTSASLALFLFRSFALPILRYPSTPPTRYSLLVSFFLWRIHPPHVSLPHVSPTHLSLSPRYELTDTGDTKNIDHLWDVLGYDSMRDPWSHLLSDMWWTVVWNRYDSNCTHIC